MTIGERIKTRRKELHMTLADLSAKTGVPKSTIQRWESGAITNMGQESLRKVADALNTSVPFLQTGVSVSVQFMKRPEPDDTDVFEYLCKENGYRYSSHIHTDRYYDKHSSEFVCINEKSRDEIMKQVAHYFGYLMHERALSLEEFIDRVNRNEKSSPDPGELLNP